MKQQRLFRLLKKGFYGLTLWMLVASLVSCSGNRQVENNQKVVNKPKSAYQTQKRAPFWQESENDNPLNLTAFQDEKERKFYVKKEEIAPPSTQYAADEALTGQNISSMIEGKIYNLVEDAYRRRDYNEFTKLYALFVESFPHSSQKGILDERRRTFFYRENLNIEKLQGALLEVSYPEAKSFQELGLYFERLRDNGIASVQMNVVQFMGTPVFLFANPKKGEGYYFNNFNNLTVDNVLGRIVTMAHDNGLQVFASFPLRHHPRLGGNSVYLLDESWNIFQNRTTPNSKLDLLNPDSRDYLFQLVEDLLKFKLDGIVLKDDFTYEINEGFSDTAIDRYISGTGQPLAFNKMFIPVNTKVAGKYEILTSAEFKDVALWRSREIAQLLWDLVEFVKKSRSDFVVGLEVTPEMMLDRFNPLKWYSTNLKYIKDLNVDFYVLKWRKFNSSQEAEGNDYEDALQKMRTMIPSKRKIFLRIPLSQMTKNTIELNRKIANHTRLQKEFKGIKISVGPIDRIEKLDIIN